MMSIDIETHLFKIPEKCVLSPQDIEKWEKSEAYQDILGFLTAMNKSVKGKKISVESNESEVVKGICGVLHDLCTLVDQIQPLQQPQRYGNKAFKQFYSRLKAEASNLLNKHLPSKYSRAIDEIVVYLIESFGNSTRIDYGTGHELSFIMFLCCLYKIEALIESDAVATVSKIFVAYIALSRKLQTKYKMEPAGSQGVWSLDDYQFVPFIWGSSQLMMNPKISPEQFTNENVVNEFAHEYLFLDGIKFILKVKSGPFAEHSNQLWNISAVQSWSKINQGLLKMYKAEILHKFPIIQHVLFGSLLTMKTAEKTPFLPPMDMGPLKSSMRMAMPMQPLTTVSGGVPRPLEPMTRMPDTTSRHPISAAISMPRASMVIPKQCNETTHSLLSSTNERGANEIHDTSLSSMGMNSMAANKKTNFQ